MPNNKLTLNFSVKMIFHANLFARHDTSFENAQSYNPQSDM